MRVVNPFLWARRGCAAVLLTVGLAGGVAIGTGVASATAPALVITPKGPFHNGETIKISAGPNKFFRAFGRVNVLECADPGGKKSNLPKDDTTCDGNTIQGNTILVKKNGSFAENGYQLFVLPNPTLGELANGQPVCNKKHPCVLYVGEDQSNFNTWPKEFSSPFTISSGKGS